MIVSLSELMKHSAHGDIPGLFFFLPQLLLDAGRSLSLAIIKCVHFRKPLRDELGYTL